MKTIRGFAFRRLISIILIVTIAGLYCPINVDAEGNDDASLVSVYGLTGTVEGSYSGADINNKIIWSINVPFTTTKVWYSDVVVAPDATCDLYLDSSFTSRISTSSFMGLSPGSTTSVYVKVTAQDNTTVRYYRVKINRAAGGSVATLKATSKVKGVQPESLGTPNSTFTSVSYGKVYLNATQAADTSNTGSFVTLFEPTDANAKVMVVKFPEGLVTESMFAQATAYNNEAISNYDCFIVKVTAENGYTVNYYKVDVIFVNSNATLDHIESKIKGLQITNLGIPAAAIEDVKAGAVSLTTARAENTLGSFPYLTLFRNYNPKVEIKAVKYAKGASTANFSTDPSYSQYSKISNNDFFIVRVTSGDKTTVNYYKIVVTIDNTAPFSTTGYPRAGQVQGAGTKKAEVLVNSNETGTAFYVVQTSTMNAPTQANVTAGRNANNATAIASGSAAISAGTERSIMIENLLAYSTDYAVYVVVADTAGNMSSPYRADIRTPGEAQSSDATLQVYSIIKGQPLKAEGLGTPAAAMEAAAPGTIDIPRVRALDTSNAGAYVTLFKPNNVNAAVKAVKYERGASAENFASDEAYENQAIAYGDFFIVRVTAENGSDVRYYRMDIEDCGAGLVSVAGQTAAEPGTQSGAIGDDAIVWDVNVPYEKTELGLNDIAVSENATKNLYYYSDFITEIKGTHNRPLAVGSTTVYVRVTSQDETVERYYVVRINRAASNDAAVKAISAYYTVEDAANTIAANTMPITTATTVSSFLSNLTKAGGADWKVIAAGTAVAGAADFKNTVGTAGTDTLSDGDSLAVLAEDSVTLRLYTIIITAASGDAGLKGTSTIKGQQVSNLGVPADTIEGVTAGEVSITQVRAANTSNAGSYITLFDRNCLDTAVKVVKYSAGASAESFETDAEYNHQAIADNDFFVVKVTAADSATVRYYKIIVKVDGTSPSFVTNYPRTGQIQAAYTTDGEVLVKTNESGTVYYAAVMIGSGLSPSVEQVLAGKDASNNAASASGSIKIAGNTVERIKIRDLPNLSTIYDVYLIIKDEAGNLSPIYPAAIETPSAGPSNDAALSSYSTIKGERVNASGLGASASTLNGIVSAGTVRINSIQAADTSDTEPFMTLFEKNHVNADVKAVKYAEGASTADFETDTAYSNEAIANGDFFIVKVTAENGVDTRYYKIVVIIPNDDATLKATSTIKGKVIADLGTPGTTISGMLPGRIALNTIQAYSGGSLATIFASNRAGATVKAVKYASGAATTGFDTAESYANQYISNGDFFIVRVISSDGSTTKYYKVVVTVASDDATISGGSLAGVPVAGTFGGGADIPNSTPITVTIAESNRINAALLIARSEGHSSIKYIKRASQPTSDSDYWSTYDGPAYMTVTDGDTIWLKVTAQDAVTKRYYKITVTVLSSNAAISGGSLAGKPLTSTNYFYPGNIIGNSNLLNVTVNDTEKTDAVLVLTKSNTNSAIKYVKQESWPMSDADYTFTYEPGTAMTVAHNDIIWLMVTAQDGITKGYYRIVTSVRSNDAGLKASSKVKGQQISSLGTPAPVISEIVSAGAVTITPVKAANTSNTEPYRTLFEKSYLGAAIKVVKYAAGAATENFATDAAYADQAISDNDFFIVKVTATDMTTVNYYKVVVTVDGTAPSFISGYPREGQLQAGGTKRAEVLVSANEPATAYYVVLPFGSSAPSNTQLLNGKDIYNDDALDKGSVYITANTVERIITNNLPAHSTRYDVYILLMDAAGNTTTYSGHAMPMTPGATSSNHTNLITNSTIKGKALESFGLGWKSSTLAGLTSPGSLTLTSAQAADTSNDGAYITSFITYSIGASAKAVKYSAGADTSTFETDAAYSNDAISNNDFFIVKVTAEDAETVGYYKTVVKVPTADATITSGSLAGIAISGDFYGAAEIENSSPLTVTIPETQGTNATLGLVRGNSNSTVRYVKGTQPTEDSAVSYTDLYVAGGSTKINAADGDTIWLQVTAQDGIAKKYYKLTVTVQSSNAGLAAVAGQTVSAGTEAGTITEPKTASINVEDTVATVAAGSVEGADARATVTFYGTDNTFTSPATGDVSLALGGGTVVYIKVMAHDNTTLYYVVTVNRAAGPAVSEVTLNKSTTTILEGQTEKLESTVSPENVLDHTVAWLSGNSSVASVDQYGTVTAVRPGIAEIKASSNQDSSKYAVCRVIVIRKDCNGDGKTDIDDLMIVTQAYGSRKGDALWNESADLNGDEAVNDADIRILKQYYLQ